MNKAALPDFYDIYSKTTKFTDYDFSHDDNAMAWADASEVYEGAKDIANSVWKRASKVFPGKSLFGTKGITP